MSDPQPVLNYETPDKPKTFWDVQRAEGWDAAIHFAFHEHRYTVGTLKYSIGSLIVVCGWMIWGGVCWGLMQRVFPALMPLQLKEIGAPNQAMATLQKSIPNLLAFILVPIISFKSDRHRGRWGRRKPFILLTAPFTVLFLISLAYVKDIFQFMNRHEAYISSHVHFMSWHLSAMGCSLACFGFLIVGFMFFDDFVNSVGWYLIADVIPVEVMGKFNAAGSMVGMIVNIFWNTWIYPHALTHTKVIYAAMGLLYFAGYGLMCLMVKEGDLPPVDLNEKRANRFQQTRSFLRESFSHPLYASLFMFDGIWAVTNACSSFSIYFSTDTIHLSLAQIGRINAILNILTGIIAIPIGLFLDWMTPLRSLILATVAIIPAVFAGYFVYGFRGALLVGVIGAPIGALWDATKGPMMMQMLPRSKYGQFSAANSMVRSLINIFIANIGAWYLDRLDNNYRMIYIWQCGWMIPALLLLFYIYYQYRKNGGPNHYVAPLPSFSGDEMAFWTKVSGISFMVAGGLAFLILVDGRHSRFQQITAPSLAIFAIVASALTFSRNHKAALICGLIFAPVAGLIAISWIGHGLLAFFIHGGIALLAALVAMFGLAGLHDEIAEKLDVNEAVLVNAVVEIETKQETPLL